MAATFPAHFNLEKVIRPNILALQPYRCARDDYDTGILLDANENTHGHSISPTSLVNGKQTLTSTTNGKANEVEDELPEALYSTLELPLHRYPSPTHLPIKSRIAALRGLPSPDYVFLGVGSDEVIDLLMRVCVTPGGKEKVLITPPTYGMYKVCAQVNDVGVIKCDLELGGEKGEGGESGRFSLRIEQMKKTIVENPSTKLIILCSPGNPTGTLISLTAIREILEFPSFTGIVVVDEAYIDFASDSASAASLIEQYANLCVMQTLSKGFGLAGIRLGIALAQPPLIQILSNTKAPYNISLPTAHLALAALSPPSLALTRTKIEMLNAERTKLEKSLVKLRVLGLGLGEIIGSGDANFVLVRVLEKPAREGGVQGKNDGMRLRPDNKRAQAVYKAMAEEKGVVVRYRGGEPGCEGALRITVGTESENEVVVRVLEELLRTL